MHARTVGIGAFLLNTLFAAPGLAQDTPAAGGASENRAIQALAKEGITQCAKAKTIVLDFLYKNGDYGYLNQWNTKDPDKHATLTSIAKTYSDGTVIASVVGAPTAGGCDVSFTQVLTSAESCTSVRETAFKDWVYAGKMAGASVYEEKEDKTLTIVLASQPNGCLIAKYGILFFPDK